MCQQFKTELVIDNVFPNEHSDSGGPIEAVANVVGNINGQEFGTALLIANVSTDQREYSLVTARMYNIPDTVGELA